ncbi:MAG: AAA family ATPase, partial [Lactobacillus amylovorus]
MKTSLLKGIIYGQRQIIREAKIIPREYSFDPNFNYVLVGLRRAGKSTLLYKVAQDLVKNGVDWDQIIYVNFEDERLLDFTVNDFNDIVLTANEITPKKHYYFFDEIQNIDGWEYFARRMADEKQYVYITGSNAKMLSGDIQTHLGGRYMIKYIAPFNFREYLTAKNIRHDEEALYTTALNGQIRGAMNAYLKDGGLPETINAIEKRDYLNNIYNNVLLRDVVYKNGVRSPEVLRNLIKKLSESV